jgi:hypothetical protein
MNIKQVEMLLRVLKDSFGNSKAYDGETVAQSWHLMGLDNLPFDGVMAAAKEALGKGQFEYPPSLNDITRAYDRKKFWENLGNKTITLESLSERSAFKHAIIRMVKRRFSGFKKGHQFASLEDKSKSESILEQQRKKYEIEVFEKFLPMIQSYALQGHGPHRCVELAFGPDFVAPRFRTELQKLPGGSTIAGLIEDVTNKLPQVKSNKGERE